MIGTKRTRARIIAVITMFLGTLLVFSGVIAMNTFVTKLEQANGPATVDFAIEKIRKNPPRKDMNEIKPRRNRTSKEHHAIAPLPDLGTNLSSIQIEIPDYRFEDVGAMSDSLLGDLVDVVMTEDAVDTRPVPRMQTPIDYPPRARANNLEGRVVLSILIGSDGLVKKVKVLESMPPGIFEQVVLAAVTTWVFEPATYKSKCVEVWATLPIEFSIS